MMPMRTNITNRLGQFSSERVGTEKLRNKISHASRRGISMRSTNLAAIHEQKVKNEQRRLALLKPVPLPEYIAPTKCEQEVKKGIPRRIIQSWVNRNLTPEIVKLCKSHIKCNPGYQYVFYDDQECREFLQKHYHENVIQTYDAILPGAYKADFFRYCELYVHGGWWFDIDILSLGSIDSIIPPQTEFACCRDIEEAFDPDVQYALYQAMLGASPGHPILEMTIRQIINHVSRPAHTWTKNAPHERFYLTGPVLIGSMANKYLGKDSFDSLPSRSYREGQVLIGSSKIGEGIMSIEGRGMAIGHSQSGEIRCSHQQNIHNAYQALKARVNNRTINDARAKAGGAGDNSNYRQPNPLFEKKKPEAEVLLR